MHEIAEKGDQYAKRMLVRKKEQDQSPECYSKSIRRRLSIMEAIKGKINTPPRVSVRSSGNPFKKEFSNESAADDSADEFSRSYVTTWPDDTASPASATDEPGPHRPQRLDEQLDNDHNSEMFQRGGSSRASIRHPAPRRRHQQDRGSTLIQQQQQRAQYRHHASPDLYYATPVHYNGGEAEEDFVDGDSVAGKPRMSIDANSNEIEWHRAPKPSLIFPGEQRHQAAGEPEEEVDNGRVSMQGYAGEGKRSSMMIGEYLHRADKNGLLTSTYAAPVFTPEDLQSQEYLANIYEQDFQRGNAELERKGVNQFFGARVLEILEPQLVEVERQSEVEPSTATNRRQRASMQFVQESFQITHQPQLLMRRDEPDSTTTSFVSDNARDHECDAEKAHYRPPSANTVRSQQQRIAETPVRLYPKLDLAAELADKVTPKKLFHKSNIQDTSESVYGDNFHTNTTATFEEFQKSSNLDNEAFSTPLMIPMSQPPSAVVNHQDHRAHREDAPSANSSFIKRSASFLMHNLPNVLRRKPNLESTRNVCNGGRSKMASPGTSRGASTISTLTIPNTPSSPNHYEQARAYQDYQKTIQVDAQQIMENTIPYEVENFFKLAVGDEYSSTMITYAPCDMQDQLSSHINASELISEDRSPVKNVIHVMRVPKTEQPNHSSTLNRTLSFYKTLTQRIKKKFRGSIKDRTDNVTQPDIILPDAFPSLKDSVKKLLEEVDIQQTLIYQASKALELCSSMREFEASSERVESERLLMLASLRKKAALDEIRRLTGRQSHHESYCELADLTIGNLSLQLRDGALRCDRQGGPDYVEWFVVVVTQGLTVWASQAFVCPKIGTKLDISGKITIPNLTPDFRVTVKVYNLRLQQQALYNHEEKYHIAKRVVDNRHTATCPSPKILLKRVERKRNFISPKQFEIKFSGIKESSFNLCGSVDLMLHDLNLLPPWPLNGVPPNSVLYGTVDLSLTSDLHLAVSHAGFLTVGDEAGGFAVWNRRWCILEGRHLHFWNYPREQECKPPLYSIDLAGCVSRRISLVDRSMCARPRTLLVETSRRRKAVDRNTIVVECRTSCTILRNLLSCDTNQDLVEWQTKLNHVVCALREWSVMETKPLSYGTEVSDL